MSDEPIAPWSMRPYRDDDTQHAVELLRAVADVDGAAPPDEASWRAFVDNGTNRGGGGFRCIEQGGRLVGLLVSGWFDDREAPGGVQLGRVLVHPAARRRGLGRALLRELEAHAARRGAGAIQGITRQKAAAGAAFCAQAGFRLLVHDLRMRRPMDLAIPPAAWPQAVTLRPYRGAEDDEPWAELANACFARDTVAVQLTAQSMEEMRDDPGFEMRAAERDGRMIGFCWVNQGGPELGVLQGLGVDANHRRGGVARALVVEALQLLAAQACTRVELTTEVDNEAAITLYRSLGFSIVEEIVSWRRELR
ncbi:MAG: GNAT family N-acetyltransferase [Polyangiaceae bacterium]